VSDANLIGVNLIGVKNLTQKQLDEACGNADTKLPAGLTLKACNAKAEFKAAWEALKARTTPEQLAAAYKAMNIRDDG
jgi:hypothetical protein